MTFCMIKTTSFRSIYAKCISHIFRDWSFLQCSACLSLNSLECFPPVNPLAKFSMPYFLIDFNKNFPDPRYFLLLTKFVVR